MYSQIFQKRQYDAGIDYLTKHFRSHERKLIAQGIVVKRVVQSIVKGTSSLPPYLVKQCNTNDMNSSEVIPATFDDPIINNETRDCSIHRQKKCALPPINIILGECYEQYANRNVMSRLPQFQHCPEYLRIPPRQFN